MFGQKGPMGELFETIMVASNEQDDKANERFLVDLMHGFSLKCYGLKGSGNLTERFPGLPPKVLGLRD